jgi:hypothetical protein
MTSEIATLPYMDIFGEPPVLSGMSTFGRYASATNRGWPAATANVHLSATVTRYFIVDEFSPHVQKLIAIESDEKLWPEGAEGPTQVAINSAWEVIGHLKSKGFPPTKIVASGEGGVAVCFVSGDMYADIECLNSGAILGVTTNRRDRPNAWEIDETPGGIEAATHRISQFLNSRAPKKNDSRGSRNR